MPVNEPPPALWNDTLLQSPHSVSDKRTRVQRMFAAIAPSYDLNNRLHSLWMDQRWRRRAVQLAQIKPSDTVVDVACGTGDLSLKFARALASTAGAVTATGHGRVLGIDFTHEMLHRARHKAQFRKSPSADCCFICGDAMRLPLADASADVVSIAFGIRNVADPAVAIKEFYRILRPGGRLVILEFSLPTNSLLRALYNFYFRQILPRTASLLSGDQTGAYKYLPESVNTFIGREQMIHLMQSEGFGDVEQYPLTLGVCVCYGGRKPS